MKYPLFLLLLALLIGSCKTPGALTSEVTVQEVDQLNYFAPFSYIQLIDKGNRTEPSDSLSAITEGLLDSLLTADRRRLHLNQKISVDSITASRVEGEIAYLAQTIMARNKLSGITLPPAIDSVLEASGQRFGLAVVATGFGRRRGNFGGQVAKGVLVGIVTLGAYAPVPVKSSLQLFAFIFDAERNDVAYYRRVLPVEKEPTDAQIVEAQLREAFSGYFYPSE